MKMIDYIGVILVLGIFVFMFMEFVYSRKARKIQKTLVCEDNYILEYVDEKYIDITDEVQRRYYYEYLPVKKRAELFEKYVKYSICFSLFYNLFIW